MNNLRTTIFRRLGVNTMATAASIFLIATMAGIDILQPGSSSDRKRVQEWKEEVEQQHALREFEKSGRRSSVEQQYTSTERARRSRRRREAIINPTDPDEIFRALEILLLEEKSIGILLEGTSSGNRFAKILVAVYSFSQLEHYLLSKKEEEIYNQIYQYIQSNNGNHMEFKVGNRQLKVIVISGGIRGISDENRQLLEEIRRSANDW